MRCGACVIGACLMVHMLQFTCCCCMCCGAFVVGVCVVVHVLW